MPAEASVAGSFAPVMFEAGASPSGDVIFLSVDDVGTPGALNSSILKTLGLSDKYIPADSLDRGYAFVDAGKYRLCFIVTVRISGMRTGTEFLLSANLGNALAQIDKQRYSSSVAQQFPLRLWIPLMGTGSGGLAGDKSLSVILSVLEETGLVQRGVVSVIISSAPDTARSDADEFRQQVNDFNSRLGFAFPQPAGDGTNPSPHRSSEAAPAADSSTSDDIGLSASPASYPANPDSRRRAVLNNDQIAVDDDVLGAQMEMEALARIAVDGKTIAPLAIGIFGDWGAGKSSFMERMSMQVDALNDGSKNSDKTYRNAVQVRFNAWHYVDTNLWASLVENIFSCLDEHLRSREGGAKLADMLFSKLATPQRLRLESAERVSNASKAVEIAQRHLEQERQKAEVAQSRRSVDIGKLLRVGTRAFEEALSPEQKEALQEAAHELGLPADIDATRQLVKQAQRARTLIGRLALVWRSIARRVRSPAQKAVWLFIFACLVFIGYSIGGNVARWISGDAVKGFANVVGVVLGVMVGAMTTVAALAGKALKAVTALGRFAKEIQSEMSGVHAADEAARQELVALAERNVVTAAQELQLAKNDFQCTSSQRLLTEFIRDKAGGDSYSKHLGLVATIRKDFDRLSQIMCGAEEHPTVQDPSQQKIIRQYRDILEREGLTLEEDEASEGLGSLKRIILYIDDLDRCRPDKVAEVLQAVHLLLAFPLFVVVVAVDYRWVASALRAFYKGQLADEIDRDSGYTGKGAAGDAAQTSIAQPDDYIEKIFQIPYWVRPIDEATGAALLQSLTKGDVVTSSADPEVTSTNETSKAGEKGDDNPGNRPPDVADPSIAVPPAHPRSNGPTVPPPVELADQEIVLDQYEIDFMKRLAFIAGRTPRRLKRFVNSYRVIKAALRNIDLGHDSVPEKSGFLIPIHQAILLQLAFATGHASAFIRYSDEQAHAAESELTVTQLVRRLEEVIDKENCLPADFTLGLKLLSPLYDNSSTLIRMTEYTRLAARFSFCNPGKIATVSPPSQAGAAAPTPPTSKS